MKRVVGLGACVYDTLIECGEYPREDTKYRADNTFISGGGPVSNALVVMSKLGVRAEYLGAFAEDAAGDFLLQDFKKAAVGTEYAVRAGKRSFSSYIVLSETGGTRTCIFDKGDIPDDPRLLDFSCMDGADLLHLDGNYLECAIAAAEIAKRKSVPVSLDAGGLYRGIERLLPYIDILIPSAEFAQGITGESTAEKAMAALYKEYKPRVIAVTCGKDGGFYLQDGHAEKYSALHVKSADTNGAGDTFHGAFIVAFLAGESVEDCCKYASRVAAYKCARRGLRGLKFDAESINACEREGE